MANSPLNAPKLNHSQTKHIKTSHSSEELIYKKPYCILMEEQMESLSASAII